ncbi:DUF4913 domain-containing protein [Streptomyces sp. AK02-01A]|uniref:DUF4913 domain-containing protein n=1 Tax=Streptomyces sp. AK02-01A TaxID=3028648 RepID=UPI0029B8C621|nr:DUF4913 domain-containing protein [Streptomyces sp. AK02-01A]MDX3854916.1 DUF4913 domain-containing protein [Streptomyces sp. AK02-01A]
MSEPPSLRGEGELEPVRLPETSLENIETSVRRLMDQTAEQARQLDTLAVAPLQPPNPFAAFGLPGMPDLPARPAPADPRPIHELEGEEFENELDALTDWVDDFLMRIYGAEVTTAAPWCERWQQHGDVVAWLHALWMAYQQHKDPEAGLSGMFVWHRDFLTHAMAAVRAPGGPLSACMTSPDRAAHRLLHGPARSERSVRVAEDVEAPGGQEGVTG